MSTANKHGTLMESNYRKYYMSDQCSAAMAPGLTQDLRPLSDMTDEEAVKLARMVACSHEFTDVRIVPGHFNDKIVQWGKCPDNYFNATGEIVWTADQFHYLLQQRFDVFNLTQK